MKGFLICLFFLLSLFATVSAEQITVEYLFEYPQIETINLGGQTFDRVIMKDVSNCGKAGQPALPADGARILLPFGTDVSSIKIIADGQISLGSGFNIEPVGKPVKLASSNLGTAEPPVPDSDIYSSDQPFPAMLYEEIGVHGFRGYQILTVRLQPVQYIPSAGELIYSPRMTIVVNTADSERKDELLRGLAEDEAEVLTKIDNPEIVKSYLAGPVSSSKSYDMLIITTTTLASSFQPLKDYHDTTGLITEIHTTADIGSSSPDDIRDYIEDRYIADGIQYVIIGADDDIIPAKDLYVESDDGSNPEIEYSMPSDVYFGCLDGTYNYDGDSYWGEPNDGDGGGDVDLIAEVYVGRASVGNTTEADRFVNKTLWYLTKQHSNLQNVVLVGEHLGFGGVSEYANFFMDELVDGSSANGYTTVGIPSDQYTIDKLYDYDWSGNDWPQSELVTRINNGQHVVNHLGHGSPDYAMKLYDSDVMSDLTNTDLCLVYSQTCLAGHLDDTDCWAEYMNIKTDHGAFAVIMNARYGWGSGYSTDGPSQRFNREFWDAIFSPTEGKPELGRANQDSKEDNLYRISDDCMRWCYYELNLFGDPSVSVMGVTGLSFTYPNGIPTTIEPGVSTTVDVVVAGMGDGVPVSGSGQLHYQINGGAIYSEAMTEIFLNQYIANLPAVTCEDTLEFYFSADEIVEGTIYNPNPATPFSPIIASEIITIFSDDFESDLGWTVSGGSWARGTPTGGGGEYGGPDPSSGHSGSNVFGYNLSGDYENSMPERHLTSPAIDCSDMIGVKLNFFRWLGVEQPDYDHAYIRISTDGTTWVTIWENSGGIEDDSWVEMEFDISQYADGESTVYLRWTMGSTDSGWRYCGWNIDDVILTSFTCNSSIPVITTESLPDWTVGIAYSEQLEAVNGTGVYTWADKYNKLAGSGLSLTSSGLLEGTPTSAGVISFTAEATDETPESGEKVFSFTINPAPAITTSSLPDWTAGLLYSQQLAMTGGTGTITWSDKNGDLSGTGLVLSSTGHLLGTPTMGGTISFTAQVTDIVGAFNETVLSITVNPSVDITTTTLPNGMTFTLYSEQLITTGGTGTITWSDKNSDLDGTDFTLSATGLLSGTPQTAITITLTVQATDAVGFVDEQILSFAINEGLVISTEQVNNWTVGNPFSFQLESVGGLGTKSWSDKNGDLDGTGLSVSTAGLITGTPNATGDITFTAMVSDESKISDEKEFTFTINSSLVIDTESLPDWTGGFPYSYQLTSSGGTGDISWGDKDGGLSGTGLTLSSDGLLSGTYAMGGSISFMSEASDQGGDVTEKQFDFIFNPPLFIDNLDVTEITVNTVYSSQLSATGGTGTLVFSDKNGNLAGTGLTLSVDGLLEGTPSVVAPINFTTLVTDSIGATKEKSMLITINQEVNITTASMPEWTINSPYSLQLECSGGTGTMSWGATGLDGTGLSIDENGLISGTPTTEGELPFTASLTDYCGSYDEQLLSVIINPEVVISTETVPDGKEDEAYSTQLEVTGGTGTKSWLDLNDDLVGTGLALSESGLLSGTPITAGSITFSAEAIDQTGSGDVQLLDIYIAPEFICGDVDGNEIVNILDITYLIAFLYKDGLTPDVYDSGDVNSDGTINILDVTSLIDFLYQDGPDLVCP